LGLVSVTFWSSIKSHGVVLSDLLLLLFAWSPRQSSLCFFDLCSASCFLPRQSLGFQLPAVVLCSYSVRLVSVHSGLVYLAVPHLVCVLDSVSPCADFLFVAPGLRVWVSSARIPQTALPVSLFQFCLSVPSACSRCPLLWSQFFPSLLRFHRTVSASVADSFSLRCILSIRNCLWYFSLFLY
jgi:hypothetical protein